MPLAKISKDVGNIAVYESARQFIAEAIRELVSIVNGKIQFQTNILCKVIDVNFVTANAELAITHNLGFVPTGYILVKSSAVATLYDGVTAWNSNEIFVKSNAVTTAKVMIF